MSLGYEPSKTNKSESGHDLSTDEGLKSFVDHRRKQALNVRQKYEGQYYLNMAFYAGRQWVYWNRAAQELQTPKLPEWRETITVNLIMPIIEQIVAKETKNQPILKAKAATGDEEDINAAKLADRFLEYIWERLEMDEKWQRMKLWKRVCGKVFLKAYWDPTAGDLVQVYKDEEGNVVPDEVIEQMTEQGLNPEDYLELVEFNLGDVCVEVKTFQNILVDPAANTLAEAEWLIEESVRSIEWVKDNYEVEVSADSVDPMSFASDQTAFEDGYRGGLSDTDKIHELDHHVRVTEYWEAPCSKYPGGRLIICAGDKVVHAGDFPKGVKEIPYTEYEDIHVLGRFWSDSIVKHLIPLQTEVNKTTSQVVEIKKMTSKPQMLSPKGSIVTKRTGEPGLNIEYLPVGQPPRVIQPPSIPAYVFQHLSEMRDMMQFLAGIRDISMGDAPTGITSGIALNILAERDDTRIGPKTMKDEKSLAKLGSQILALVQKNYEEDRKITVAGDNNEVEVIDFNGAMVRSTDVEVEAGSSLPESKAAKQAFIMDLVSAGLLNPENPDEKKKILRYMQIGITEPLYEEAQLDLSRAMFENRQMKGGTFVQPQLYEDHFIHIQEHDNFRKRRDFDSLHPEVQEMFEAHVTMHKDLQVKKEQEDLLRGFMVQSVLPQPPPEEGPPGASQGPPGPPPMQAPVAPGQPPGAF